MDTRADRRLEGWSVFWAAAGLGILPVTTATLALAGTGEAGLRAGIRATAAVAVLLFVAAFAASSLVKLWPAPATKWLRRNRRAIGVAVAAAMLAHAGLIAALVAGHADSLWKSVAPTTLAGGGLGYAFLAAMVATSFDRTTKAVGKKAWRALHTAGMYFLWIIFVTSYVGRAAEWPYALYVALLAGALGLRVAARLR